MTVENTTDSTTTTATETAASGDRSQAEGSSSSIIDETEISNSGETILTADGGSAGVDDGDKTKDKADETPEQKAAREADEAKAVLFGAPEGDYELTLPEGVTEIDKDALAAVTPVAKELGLSNDGLSRIAAVYATDVLPGVARQVVVGIERDIAAQTAAWATEATLAVEGGKDGDSVVEPDPIFAGKTFKEVKALSAKALDRFGGTEFRTYLDETGLGNRLPMLKFAFLAGSAISEDTSFERGIDIVTKPKSREDLYYGPSQTATT